MTYYYKLEAFNILAFGKLRMNCMNLNAVSDAI